MPAWSPVKFPFHRITWGGDQYDWEMAGLTGSIPNWNVNFDTNSIGTFTAKLTVSLEKWTRSSMDVVETGNTPQEGQAMSVVTNGGIETSVVNAGESSAIEVDDVDNEAITDLEYNAEDDKLYYTGTVHRANPNGTEKELIIPNLAGSKEHTTALAIDQGRDRIYYARAIPSSNFYQVWFAGFDGSGQTETTSNIFSSVPYLEFWEKGNTYFYIQSSSNYSIESYNMNSFTTSRTFYGITVGDKEAIAIDQSTDRLYFVEMADTMGQGVYRIGWYDLNNENSQAVSLLENVSMMPILGMDIDEENQTLYYSDQVENAIFKVDLRQGDPIPEKILENISNPRAIAVGNFDN